MTLHECPSVLGEQDHFQAGLDPWRSSLSLKCSQKENSPGWLQKAQGAQGGPGEESGGVATVSLLASSLVSLSLSFPLLLDGVAIVTVS